MMKHTLPTLVIPTEQIILPPFAEDLLSPLSTQAGLPSSVSDDIDILTIYTLHAYCARVLQCRGRDSSVDREPDS